MRNGVLVTNNKGKYYDNTDSKLPIIPAEELLCEKFNVSIFT